MDAKVSDLVNDKLAAIGEKIGITKLERVDADYVASYIHGANRIGVLVGMNKPAAEAGKDIAMQIAAMNPVAVDQMQFLQQPSKEKEQLLLIKSRMIQRWQVSPHEMIDKIAEGKLNAFFKESTLLSQPFVKDSSKTVADNLKSIDPQI